MKTLEIKIVLFLFLALLVGLSALWLASRSDVLMPTRASVILGS